ncbi:shikimate dehydrogenase [Microcella daejeonensis]|uniref:Shikimate dehydrogenase n=1 Tax=Microcella daejeonensis TaxID=2994971 RepID=A0A9E8S850_9MICO|nr:shikimate dehydrogenase [Microcella daejeonensis]WAB81185.1 shikimate dehydrogenase [Microcella daejeonensis]
MADPVGSADRRRLAVIGSPIEHSLSPALHAAAYARLGLDWAYGREQVTVDGLPAFLDGLDGTWRGLSATMPLKEALLPLLDAYDEDVALTGAANTVLLHDGRRTGRNTDIAGVRTALERAGLTTLRRAAIVGAGATARSIVVALARLGAVELDVLVREESRAGALLDLAERLGLEAAPRPLGDLERLVPAHEVVAWTLPNGVPPGGVVPEAVRRASTLLDVTYHPWPSPLAEQWRAVDGAVASGRDMLLHQAVRQVRLFVGGPDAAPMPEEAEVERAMAAALA